MTSRTAEMPKKKFEIKTNIPILLKKYINSAFLKQTIP